MAKSKKAVKTANARLRETASVVDDVKVENTLTEAVGGDAGIGGFLGGRGYSNVAAMGGSPEQLSNSTTMFTNLRWYLVSNFRQLLTELYVEIGLVQTIVDLPVDDALRGGVKFKSKQLEEEELHQLHQRMKVDNDFGTAGFAAKWNRLFGGAGIIVIVDGQDPETELDLKAIKKGTKVWFRAVDMWELFWDKQNTEGFGYGQMDYGQEEDPLDDEDYDFYEFYGQKIHKSRVLKFKGLEAPSFIRPRLRGWGLSVVETLVRSINQYLKAADLTFEVLDEFKVDVYKMKNLVNTLLTPAGTNQVKKRVQLANWQKNYQNAVVMDADDDWDHKQLSFAGLAEAQAGIRKQVCSDMRFPATKLFGSSEGGGGIGNADQNDMENYNSMVESTVRTPLEPNVNILAQIRCQQLFGFIPDDLEADFKPLRVMTAVDEETVKTQKFQRLATAKANGDITTQEYRDACNKGGLFDVQLDTEEDAENDDPQLESVLSGESAMEENEDNEGANGEDSQKGSEDRPKKKAENKKGWFRK